MNGRLTLISPFDPSVGFNVGYRMQRNKLIYAIPDAAIVVNSDYRKGGTWTGAVEQLEKLRLVPVYVRVSGTPSRGLEALRSKGALPWPDPHYPEALAEALATKESHRSPMPEPTGLLASMFTEQPYVPEEPVTIDAAPARDILASAR